MAPYYKGLAVSVPLDLARIRAAGQRDVNRAAIHAALAARYAGERFVQVAPLDAAPEGGFFDVQGSNDTNRADLFVFGNDDQCMLVARIDNLFVRPGGPPTRPRRRDSARGSRKSYLYRGK